MLNGTTDRDLSLSETICRDLSLHCETMSHKMKMKEDLKRTFGLIFCHLQ